MPPPPSHEPARSTARAVLTDAQFLVPALVLCLGIGLLIALH